MAWCGSSDPLPAVEPPGWGVGLHVQRVVDARVGPETRHRHDAVVDLADGTQVLPRDVVGGGAVLPVARVVEHEYALGVRHRQRIGQQQRDPLLGDGIHVPRRFGEEELQALHLGRLRLDDRLRTGERGERLVPIPRRQQAGEVCAELTPLGERRNSGSKWAAYASSGLGAGGHG